MAGTATELAIFGGFDQRPNRDPTCSCNTLFYSKSCNGIDGGQCWTRYTDIHNLSRFLAELCIAAKLKLRAAPDRKRKSMARTDASDGAIASSATAAAYLKGKRRTGPLKYTPGFLYILVLFIAGKFIFADPRAILVQWGEYHLSWVEVLMVGAAMMAMAEQLRVSHPGVDNTIEAILMGAIAGVQVLLFALGAAGVRPLAIFNNTEFLMLTLISMTQAVVAILINARTLRRTIGVGDNG
jgi:hypothetical protein